MDDDSADVSGAADLPGAPSAALFDIAEGPLRHVARVAVDVSLPHVDRPFDYEIPERFLERARPGVRVRVVFAGQRVDGFILEVTQTRDPARHLRELELVLGREQVLTPEIAVLVRRVADHYCGTFADVVRLAVPPRHARTEEADSDVTPRTTAAGSVPDPFTEQPAGPGYIAAVTRGESPRACWQPVPGTTWMGDWAAGLARAAAAAVAGGRGAVLVVPDVRDVERLVEACDAAMGQGRTVALHHRLGPAARYRAFLRALRGEAQVVVGTRSAVFAPVRELGLIAVWDDGDDLHAEPRAPYPHVREVACLRAAGQNAALLLAGHIRTAEVQHLVDHDWVRPITMAPARARRFAPAVKVTADSEIELARDPLAQKVRLPDRVFHTIRDGLVQGPVLVQVPRAGYLPSIVCQQCRTPVRCPRCAGIVQVEPGGPGRSMRLQCRSCAHEMPDFTCEECGSTRWRSPVVGVTRTAEELGRAFPQTRVVNSHGGHIVDSVGPEPALVVATVGAEPIAAGGYAASCILDAEHLLMRADLRAGEEALRRWFTVSALTRDGAAGGNVVLVGPAEARPVQAWVRCDPAGFAARELADRRETLLPPAARMIAIEGEPDAVDRFGRGIEGLPDDVDILGPVPIEDPRAENETVRLLVRAPMASAHDAVRAVRAQLSRRAAAREPAVRVRVDPRTLL